jgi:hypothetical protein
VVAIGKNFGHRCGSAIPTRTSLPRNPAVRYRQNRNYMKHRLVTVFIFLILAPNVLAVLLPFENWPYTNAPMFAYYVDESVPRYRFHFLGEGAWGEKEVGYYNVGAKWSLMRYFFKYVYRDAKEASSADARNDFESRLGEFFRAFAREYEKNPAYQELPLNRIRLEAAKLDWKDNHSDLRHLVGIFDVRRGTFEHSWGKNQ